ncbi:HAAS signaling domain-containing protein [Streptomyces cavernae]|uniref:HAAS signaling domain-containing protein n=1 Tax=Streptomyces cavernae TaxID=2259034 RepID=UPI000FEC1CD7|nr:hypothetical protein [Streptomyces cavernae]
MTSRRDRLIDEYLDRFDNASVFLAADRREELRQEIVEHIDAGLEEADARHAEAVRAVLERLGPPADIVAAELGGPRSTGSTPVVEQPLSVAELAGEQQPGREDGDHQEPRDQGTVPPAASSPAVALPPPSPPPVAPPVAPPPAFAPPVTVSPVAAPGARKGVMLLIGAAVAAVFVVGVLAVSFSASDDGGPAQQYPSVQEAQPSASSPGEETATDAPSGSPTDGQYAPTLTPSDEPSEPADEPTASAT